MTKLEISPAFLLPRTCCAATPTACAPWRKPTSSRCSKQRFSRRIMTGEFAPADNKAVNDRKCLRRGSVSVLEFPLQLAGLSTGELTQCLLLS